MNKIALFLPGGGARGAYQAGVLKGLYEILQCKKIPFSMISGVSVGSINASVLAEYADDFPVAVDKLISLWANLHCHNIFHASNYALGKSVFRNISHLVIRQREAGFLLDTEPLRRLIEDNIDFSRIKLNLDTRTFETFEILTQCYESHQTISFYQHHRADFTDWHYPRHISRSAQIHASHVMASSALPLFFPAIAIDDLHYGDGSMGLIAPLRGALRFDAEKVMVLGTRQAPTLTELELFRNGEIGFAHVLGGIMNNLFADNLDRDIELVTRMNEIARMLSMWKKRYSPWRPVEMLYLRPSIDVAVLAQDQYPTMPALLRVLLNMLGAKSHSAELVSFLLFEKPYTQALIDLGYEDTMAQVKEITAFFR